jgi:hypothetical protein
MWFLAENCLVSQIKRVFENRVKNKIFWAYMGRRKRTVKIFMILLATGIIREIQDGSNMTGTNCDLFTHKQSRSYLNHLVKSRRMEQARQVACTGVRRNVYRDLVRKPQRNPHLGDLDTEARIILNAS